MNKEFLEKNPDLDAKIRAMAREMVLESRAKRAKRRSGAASDTSESKKSQGKNEGGSREAIKT